jgi:CheY-like chemotaxis protein
VEVLAALNDQAAPLARRQVAVLLEPPGQLLLTAAGTEALRRLEKAAGHEGTEALTTPQQVDVVAIDLELQSLLKRAEPGLERLG